MQWKELGITLKKQLSSYMMWMFANLGGLAAAYLANFTIWTLHRDSGSYAYMPRPDTFLISGTISLAVAGIPYLSLPRSRSVSLSPVLSLLWVPLVAAVYGILIAMGVKQPVISKNEIWFIAILIAIGCWSWSTVTWLHEQGIRMEIEEEPQPPPEPSQSLKDTAEDLRKTSGTGDLEDI